MLKIESLGHNGDENSGRNKTTLTAFIAVPGVLRGGGRTSSPSGVSYTARYGRVLRSGFVMFGTFQVLVEL